jgi:hypothetical protein
MTKSAKQDAAEPAAETAGTQSAAARAEVAGPGELTVDSAVEPVEPLHSGEPVHSGELGESGELGDSGKPDIDETKRKFREALERKNQAHSEGQGRSGRDGSKISGSHGPAASRRSFRRKSG